VVTQSNYFVVVVVSSKSISLDMNSYQNAQIQCVVNTAHDWLLYAPTFDNRLWNGGEITQKFDDAWRSRWLQMSATTIFHMHMAAYNGNADELLEEIRRNPDKIDERCYFGATALHYACEKKSADCVRTLLQHGADANAMWLLDGNAFCRAASTIGTIIEGGNRWITPFALAVKVGWAEGVRLFLEHALHQDEEEARKNTQCALDEASPFLVAVTSARSRATHFLPNDVLRQVWAFLKPNKPKHSHFHDMVHSRVHVRMHDPTWYIMGGVLWRGPFKFTRACKVRCDNHSNNSGVKAVLDDFGIKSRGANTDGTTTS
jgi:hypothetical protein